MLAIPAIDILDNKVVRLIKGDYNQKKIYAESVIEQAKTFYSFGFKRIHIVDLGGSRDGRINVLESLSEIKNKIDIEIEFGGGIRSIDDIQNLIEIGIDQIIVGSFSVSSKEDLVESFQTIDPSKIIIAADVKEEMIAIKGWTEKSSISLFEHIQFYSECGVNSFLCTDIAKDGLLMGPSINLYKNVLAKFPNIDLIASGGVSSMNDLHELERANCKKAIVGKAIYENKITLKELSKFA
ncbi:MAG: 1-(5-phosphoribosyl)-5-[(5-phosphoribosylamino)methylideneamino]imidazole-4-carboxamide isomerase [Melioribacteraceae bacterium]|nr:1-(5-phosphoribosyl)-5-[(5-phosphoribosylamino)methylideneamino]imidazole-4-carboxamide isomerase [Melioribacteraceae bacterium]